MRRAAALALFVVFLPMGQASACDGMDGLDEPCFCIPFADGVRFDMNELIERLKRTKAIGFLTKLALRSEAMDLIDQAKAYKQHPTAEGLKALRARYEGLLLKVLALLEDDPQLARDIASAREQIWHQLLEANA